MTYSRHDIVNSFAYGIYQRFRRINGGRDDCCVINVCAKSNLVGSVGVYMLTQRGHPLFWRGGLLLSLGHMCGSRAPDVSLTVSRVSPTLVRSYGSVSDSL